MRILYYNWVRYDDDEKRGGGVSVYVRNLIREMVERGHRVDFLSSGVSYNRSQKGPFVRKVAKDFGGACRLWEVVNAPVLSPGQFGFDAVDIFLNDTTLRPVIERFVERTGPYDICHFHNLEGLSTDVLKIKERFPEMRTVYSLHNYFAFCPQVNFWHRERKLCSGTDHGRRCLECLPAVLKTNSIRRANRLAYYLKRCGLGANSVAFKLIFRIARIFSSIDAERRKDLCSGSEDRFNSAVREDYARFSAANTDAINAYVDRVLCVSQRVKEIALQQGIDESRLRPNYIGTDHQQRPPHTAGDSEQPLRLAYLGYLRRDKGFYFLYKTLMSLDPALAGRLSLLVAGRSGHEKEVILLKRLATRLHGLRFVDGYNHTQLAELLKDVDLGLVPVLWEDCMPQVALELAAHGVPVLASDRGGARELCQSDSFVFRAGDSEDFVSAIARFADKRELLSDYWKAYRGAVSMKQHGDEIEECYGQ